MTYSLSHHDTLVFSADRAPWQSIRFRRQDFEDIGAATAQEVTAVIQREASLDAAVDDDGWLILQSASRGCDSSLEIDVSQSTAARALGITVENDARGHGIPPARLVSRNAEPFSIPDGAELRLNVDGKSRKFVFKRSAIGRKASADDVAGAMNRGRKTLAMATRDGRVAIVSTCIGPDSRLQTEPHRVAKGKKDAAPSLGFVGSAAYSQPCGSGKAELACRGAATGMQAVNMTGHQVELHFATGSVVLPPRVSMPVTAGQVAHPPLQRLIKSNRVRLEPTRQANPQETTEPDTPNTGEL
jgi:hypothetical protein